MTILAGPWSGAPIVQDSAPFVEDAMWNGYDKPSHRPRADTCPDICHVCPLLKNPDGKYDVMPGCMGGAVFNDLEVCSCDDPR